MSPTRQIIKCKSTLLAPPSIKLERKIRQLARIRKYYERKMTENATKIRYAMDRMNDNALFASNAPLDYLANSGISVSEYVDLFIDSHLVLSIDQIGEYVEVLVRLVGERLRDAHPVFAK
jgi:hypothetical protein